MGILKVILITFVFSMVCCVIGMTIDDYVASIPGMLGIVLFALGILTFLLSFFIPGRYVGTSYGKAGDVNIRADHYVEDGGESSRGTRGVAYSMLKWGFFLIIFGMLSVVICG